MVTFGANWCLDCCTLDRNLRDDDVARYVEDQFEFANVNVGKINLNIDLAADCYHRPPVRQTAIEAMKTRTANGCSLSFAVRNLDLARTK